LQHHKVISITHEQMANFCGNVLEVKGNDNRKLLVMSGSAYAAFTDEQKNEMLQHVDKLVHCDIPTIEEIGGGSIRCMMAELF
jgi:hypothetical protein